MIIGLTGTNSSGKGSVVELLIKKGFKHYSVRSFLIEEIKKRGLEVNRESMVLVANKLREENSSSYLVEKLYEKAEEDGGNCIIESLRTVGEIESLKKNGNFYLIAIDADIRKRYERAFLRKNESDNVSFEKFVQDEQREMESTDPNKQNLRACMEMADVKIITNGSLEELEKDVEQISERFFQKKEQKITKRKDYISWDDYFMGVALLSSRRSKDPSTQVGACIVDKENKIVGTGYNGFPIGCSDEVLPWAREGTPLETKYLYVCHAELNAILNSSKKLTGCRIYVRLFPCGECAKAIIQSGIREIVYISDKYAHLDLYKAGKKMLDIAGVKYRIHVPKINSLNMDFSPEN